MNDEHDETTPDRNERERKERAKQIIEETRKRLRGETE